MIPVYDKIIPAILTGGVWDLPKTCNFSPGVPVGPMLAKPTKGVSEILDKFQDMEFTCEYKYDGERAQVLNLKLCYTDLVVGFISLCNKFWVWLHVHNSQVTWVINSLTFALFLKLKIL